MVFIINRDVYAKLAKKVCNFTGIPPYFIKNLLFESKLLLIRVYNLTPLFTLKLTKINKYPEIKLNFGSGNTYKTGWVHIDCFFGKHIDLVVDLRCKIPFKDATVMYCYSEHFLEHLRPDEGIEHLQEVYRVLKPGGVYRIVLPDAIKFAQKYIEGDMEFFNKAHPWVEDPIEALLSIYNFEGAHKNIFDQKRIKHMAEKAGFVTIRESTAGASVHPALRIDDMGEQRVLESLYVELSK